MSRIAFAAVEIFGSEDGLYAGMGYLAQPNLVVTCAHVVANALGDGGIAWQDEPPAVPVYVRRSQSRPDGAGSFRACKICPECWRPKSGSNEPESDLAVLKLDHGFDQQQTIVPLAPGPQFRNRTFATYGYVQQGSQLDSRIVRGQCRDEIAGVIQIEPISGPLDYWIDSGLSGAPIICEQTESIIGLVKQKEKHKDVRAAFVIPAPIILGLCEEIAKPIRLNREKRLDTLTQGLGRFDDGVRAGAHSLLREYLGSQEKGVSIRSGYVPFGGRAKELRDLNDWLGDEKSSRTRLIVADAGFGKTALIAHWIDDLAADPSAPSIVYLPISRRFRTNAAQEITKGFAGRLHYFFPRDFDGVLESDVGALRRVSKRCLARTLREWPETQWLIVLDGLDEAAAGLETWRELLPREIPANLRVLLAARPRSLEGSALPWLKALGWSQDDSSAEMGLGPLSLEALSDVFATAGISIDEDRDWKNLLRVLHDRTNQGEPLLVDMYLRDLWAAERQTPGCVTVEYVSRLEPGLSAYLEGWIDNHIRDPRAVQIDETDIKIVFGVLSVVKGPVTAEDIARIGRRLGMRADDRVIHDFLSRATTLVVEIDRMGTFALWHPRLEQHFQEISFDMVAVDRLHWAILDWIRDCFARRQQGSRDPMPKYLFRHLSEHSTDPNVDLPDRALILSRAWIDAREEHDGSYASLGDDIDVVCSYLAQEDRWTWSDPEAATLLCQLVRGAIFSLSIRATADRIPSAFIIRARAYGGLTDEQALSYVRTMSKDEYKASALVQLFADLEDGAVPLALSIGRGIADPGSRAFALAGGLRRVEAERRFDLLAECRRALQFAWAREPRIVESKALALMAEFLPQAERLECARSSLYACRHGNEREQLDTVHLLMPVLLDLRRAGVDICGSNTSDTDPTVEAVWIALSAADMDLWDEADEVVRSLKHWQMVRRTVKAWLMQEKRVRTSSVLARAASHLKLLPSDTWVDAAWERLTPSQSSSGSNQDQFSDVALLTKLALQLDGDRRTQLRNVALSRARENRHYKSVCLFIVSQLFDTEDRATIISEATEERVSLFWLNDVLFHAAPHLCAEVANDLFPLVLDIVQEGGGLDGVEALERRVDPGVLRGAIDVSFTLGNDEARGNLLALVIPRLPADYLQKALNSARHIEQPGIFAEVLLALMKRGVSGLATEALKSAREAPIGIPPWRAWLLSNIAPFLDQPSRIWAFNEAFRLAAEVGDGEGQLRALLRLTVGGELDESIRGTLVEKALQAIDRIDIGRLSPKTVTAESQELEKLISAVFERITPEQVHMALDVMKRQCSTDHQLYSALTRISKSCSEDDIGLMLDTAFEFETALYRVSAVFSIMRSWPTSRMSLGLAAVQRLKGAAERGRALAILAPGLPGQLWPQALEMVWQLHDTHAEAEALAGMLPVVPDDYMPELVDRASGFGERFQAHLMVIVRARQSSAATAADGNRLRAEALAFAREIRDPEERLKALLKLSRACPLECRGELEADFIQTIGELSDPFKADFMAEIAIQLPEGARPQAFCAILASGPEHKRVEAVERIMPLMPRRSLSDVLSGIDGPFENYQAAHLLRCLPSNLLAEPSAEELDQLQMIFLHRLSSVADPYGYGELFKLLDEGICRQIAADRFCSINISEFEREDAVIAYDNLYLLVNLAPFLSRVRQDEVYRIVSLHIPREEESFRVSLLCRLAMSQSRNRRVELLLRAVEIANSIKQIEERTSNTKTIIDVMSESDQPEVFARALRLIATLSRSAGMDLIAETITKMPVAARNKVARGFADAYANMVDVWP